MAGDNTVNIAEKAAGFSISGATGSEGGVSVRVTVGSQPALTATSSSADPATWSVDVPAAAAYITGASVTLSVAAAKTGFTSPSDVTRTLAIDLSAPTAPSYTAPAALTVGEAITAMSPTGGSGIDAYSATGLPAGLAINPGSGVITGTPSAAAAAAAVTVTVADGAGNSATADLTLPAVAKGAQDLSGFKYAPVSLNYGAATPTLAAPTVLDGAALTYASSTTGVCTVADDGALTILTDGACTVTARAALTANYNAAAATFSVTVNPAGALTLVVDDVAGDNTVNIAEKTAGFTISGATGAEAGVSVAVKLGTETFAAVTSAKVGGATDATWSVPVPANASYVTGTSLALSVAVAKTGYTAPADVSRSLTVDLTAPTAPGYTAPAALTVGTAITAMSPSGGSGIDAYSATGLPAGLAINAGSGVITGTPSTANASTASVTVTVADRAGNAATVDIAFPAVAKGDQDLSGFGYSTATITYGAAAPVLAAPTLLDSAALTYTSSTTGVCTVADDGALTILTDGACTVTASAAATSNYNAAAATFSVTVNPAGALSLSVAAVAGDNTVNISEKTAGFTISGATGTEAGVSVTVKLGTETFAAVTSAKVGGATDATWSVPVPANASYVTGTSLALSVAAVKTGYTSPAAVTRTLTVDLTAPTAPGYTAPGSLKVGVALTAVSPTGGTGISRYTASGLPAGLAIGATSGVISGTPTTANAATAAVTVTVTDSGGNTDTVDITFPAVAKGAQDLSGFAYTPDSLNYGDSAPVLAAPTLLDGAALTYASSTTGVCTADSSTGVLTILTDGACTVTARAALTANYNAATDRFDITVNPAGALSLSVAAVAGDNTVNIAEKAADFNISGHTGAEAGVSVTLILGTETFAAVTSAKVQGATDATWSVTGAGQRERT